MEQLFFLAQHTTDVAYYTENKGTPRETNVFQYDPVLGKDDQSNESPPPQLDFSNTTVRWQAVTNALEVRSITIYLDHMYAA